tara:strand:+ start:6618 stop:7487 length:870 start_codon:yes stop_codon:yes gene_type:complete
MTPTDSNVRLNKNKKITAFVHIEKAAGTTLNHILRHNFFLRYIDVRPFFKESKGLFLPKDLEVAKRVLPGLSCISGHSVTASSALYDLHPNIQFVTMLRDPIKRYISQYQHRVEQKGLRLNFEEFLDIEEYKDFQTKKYAGENNLEKAKEILTNRFLLVGYLEAYDEFLVLLKKVLNNINFNPNYSHRNRTKNQSAMKDFADIHIERVIENNANDIALYKYVTEELYPNYIAEYGVNFEKDFEEFKTNLQTNKPPIVKRYIDYILRIVYIKPVTGIIRLANGKPYNGSY